jgi:hypothetical protein
MSIELFYFFNSISISEGLKLSPHTEVCPPAPEVSTVIFVYFTFHNWNHNEPLFNCSTNSVALLAVGRVWGVVMLFCSSGWDEHVFHEDSPPSFSQGWIWQGVVRLIVIARCMGRPLPSSLYIVITYSRKSNWSITHTLLYQNRRNSYTSVSLPCTPVTLPYTSVSLPYTFRSPPLQNCIPHLHYVLATYLDWYWF